MLTYSAIQAIANIVVPSGTYSSVLTEPEFAKKVRLRSVLLKENSPISYDDIRRAAVGEYYRVALRIASARFPSLAVITKNADGSESIQGDLKQKDWQWLNEEITAMLTPYGQGSVISEDEERLTSFSGGIEIAITKLTAAQLIRNIPLNSSSLKFVDIADTLEKYGLEDVDQIIKISEGGSSSKSSSTSSTESSSKGQAFLHIAHSLDLTTIPESVFNTPDVNSSPATYINTISLENVETVDTLSVNTNEIGICYFYMTGQSIYADQNLINTRAYTNVPGAPQTSQGTSFKIEKAFQLIDSTNTLNIDELITILSDEINSETLNVIGDKIANIISAPERGQYKTINQTISKRELYPLTTTLKNRQAQFDLYHRVNKLSFEVRRYSSVADTELLIISFYTVNANEWNNYLLDPTINNLRALRANGKLGIEGLIFGDQNNYSRLSNKVPYSVLLNVEKGSVAAVNIASDNAGGGTNPTDNLANSADATNTIDTFYFACTNPATPQPFIEDLIIRVTTTAYALTTPLDITVDLTTSIFTDPNIPGSLSIGEQVANKVVDAIYEYTRLTNLNTNNQETSNILGVLLGDYQRTTTVINSTTNTAAEIPLEEYIDSIPQLTFTGVQSIDSYNKDEISGRVQIVAFRAKEKEYKVIVELKQVPTNLWVGTGNFILRRTQWAEGRRRSITTDTKLLSTGAIVQNTSEELNSVKAQVSTIEASKSTMLQKVYDRREFLKDAQKGFPNKWQHQI